MNSSDNAIIFRPIPVRRIKNNYLRRSLMLTLTPIYIFIIFFINFCWMPFLYLIFCLKGLVYLYQNIKKWWNDFDIDNTSQIADAEEIKYTSPFSYEHFKDLQYLCDLINKNPKMMIEILNAVLGEYKDGSSLVKSVNFAKRELDL